MGVNRHRGQPPRGKASPPPRVVAAGSWIKKVAATGAAAGIGQWLYHLLSEWTS